MFDAPIDTWYVWVGVAIASVALAGLVGSLHTTPSPDAASVANTVDATAGSPYESTGRHPIRAEKIRLGPHRLGLEAAGKRDHAAFRYGPVTPVVPGTSLWEVATGAPPERVFESPDRYREALERARERDPEWRDPADSLVVRSLSWEGIDATLVGV